MYEYLVENLISYSQVDGNLRRTADRGLVSELYRRQMNALALKYFGVDSNGNYTENKEDIVAYRCPYSGEIISDLSTAHLEHILPVSSNGGTVLFNCIPILDKVNLSKRDEANLLVWWQEQNYFNYDRLERLIQYMLEAYTLAFKEPTEEELYDYDNSLNSDDYIENDDLSIDLKDQTSNQTNINIQQTITYYQLINDLINELSKNRDVSKYNSQLNSLKEQNTFGNIDELEKVINAVQTVFKEVLGKNSKSYLSYSLKIDMNKLLKSLKGKDYESEIRERINNIKSILMKSYKNINDYFESIQDIEESNLLYCDVYNINEDLKQKFVDNISISHNTKILIFIEMIKRIKDLKELSELFKAKSTIHFTIYKQNEFGEWVESKKYGQIGEFYRKNKKEILNNINTSFKNDFTLLSKLDDYYMNTLSGQQSREGNERRLTIFVNMLRMASTEKEIAELLKKDSNVNFQTYIKFNNINVQKNYGKIGSLWARNKERIQFIIKNDETLRNKLDDYYMNTFSGQKSEDGHKRRIEIFTDMLLYSRNEEEISDLLKQGSNLNFRTYKNGKEGISIDKEYGKIGSFWASNKNEIIPLIKKNIILRDKMDFYYMNTYSGQKSEDGHKRRIEIFIDMLNKINSLEEYANYLTSKSSEKFKTYKCDKSGNLILDKEYGEIGSFWAKNKMEIIPLIEKNEILKNKMDDYYMNTYSGQKSEDGHKRRIEIFIDMLKYQNNEQIFSSYLECQSKEKFKTYKCDKSGNLILDKEYGEIGSFWAKNKMEIIPLIEKNEILKNKMDDYYMKTYNGQQSDEGKKRRIEIFINMINIENERTDQIFKAHSNQRFKTYKQDENENFALDKEYGEIGSFWANNKDIKIIPLLFYSEDYASKKYDIARQNIMNYLNLQRRKKKQPEFKTIDEYIDTLDKTKKEVKSLIELRDSLLLRKQQLSIENQELTEELNSSYRRAM